MKRVHCALVILVWMTTFFGCAGYQYKPVPFKAPESYPNHVNVAGAVIAARAWVDQAQAREAFGFDIKAAGLTPVQIVVDNKGDRTLAIDPIKPC